MDQNDEQDWKEFIWLIGKHIGEKLFDILLTDRQYLEWFVNSNKSFSTQSNKCKAMAKLALSSEKSEKIVDKIQEDPDAEQRRIIYCIKVATGIDPKSGQHIENNYIYNKRLQDKAFDDLNAYWKKGYDNLEDKSKLKDYDWLNEDNKKLS